MRTNQTDRARRISDGETGRVAGRRWLATGVALVLAGIGSVLQAQPLVASAATRAVAPHSAATSSIAGTPLSSVLNRSGALTASHGSFNAAGYRMSLGPGGAPRFSTSTVSPRTSSGTADASWSNAFGNPGIYGGNLVAVAVSGSDVYVGGLFSKLNWDSPLVLANNIAHWDGHGWSSLGTGTQNGTNNWVRAIAVSGTTVYAGGDFTTAGGAGANYIASWNGTSWSPLGTGVTDPSNSNTPRVEALAMSGSTLYAAGTFDDAGGVVVHSVAAWDGSAWSALAGGLQACNYFDTPNHCFQAPGSGEVKALAVSGSSLYAGGVFNLVGATEVFSLAVWNGSAWSAVGGASVVDNTSAGTVNGLAIGGTTLYMVGKFDHVGAIGGGGVSAASVASWNGTVWSGLGSGATTCSGCGNATVSAVTYWSSALYISGSFSSAGGDGQGNTAIWNGTAWAPITPNLDGAPSALVATANGMVAVGTFTLGGTQSLNDVGRWDGTQWQGFGLGLSYGSNSGSIQALGGSGHNIYAGGNFHFAGATSALNIAHLSGSAWDSMAGGNANQLVFAVAIAGTDVYVGGAFSQIGGLPAANIARWDGTSWHALGTGTDGQVRTLLFYSGKLWVGGSFGHAGTGAATNIAIWDPAGQAWSRVGGGLNYNGSVYALAGLPAPNQHFVVIGGGFSQVDDGNATGTGTKYATVNGLVYFDTSATITGPLDGYYTMGGGVTTNCGSTPPCSGTVYALLVDGVKAYVGGNFDDAGTIASRSFAEFDMSAGTWSSPGVVGGGSAFGPQVNALVNVGGTYFLGGDFTSAGAINANFVASYTPATTTWAALGSGVSGAVDALAQTSDGLYVGGSFSVAGVNPSQNLALWTATKLGPVGTTTALASSSNPSTTGQNVTYTATVGPAPDGGTMAFTDNNATVTGCGAVVVSTVTGKATCTTSYSTTGSHSIAATYSGNTDFTTSKGTLTQQVNAPLSTGGLGTLAAVSTDSTTDGWAVGSYINPSSHARQTLIQRWNGSGWATVASPNVGGTTSAADVNTLNAVSARSASDAWAVGTYTDPTNQARKTLILHWNGTGWSTLTSPNPGGIAGSTSLSILTGVTADSATDAWAVGYYTDPATGASETLTVHWNGTTWATVVSPNPGGTAAGQSTQLYAASATAASDVWAAGSVTDPTTQAVETLALHWDGTSWTAVATPSLGGTTGSTQRSTLSGISADSPTDAWAVGTFTNRTTHAVEGLAMRWNGTVWSSVVTPEPGGTSSSVDVSTLSAVSADSTTDAWAVGSYTNPTTLAIQTMTLHWNGTNLTSVVSPNPAGTASSSQSSVLSGVVARSRTDAWAVGGYTAGKRLLVHWNGTRWSSA